MWEAQLTQYLGVSVWVELTQRELSGETAEARRDLEASSPHTNTQTFQKDTSLFLKLKKTRNSSFLNLINELFN